MANEEQLALLRQGGKVWNEWRIDNPDKELDFSGADLSGIGLSRVDLYRVTLRHAALRRTDFSGADLYCADLRRADFSGADLHHADLRSADLRRAILRSADLSGADLSGADLSDADLRKANLRSADLSGATLRSSLLYETGFADVDLSKVKGLPACRHGGPSIIDHRTLSRSGQLPTSFLRGVGLPDTFIDYIPSLFNQPLQFYSCFISYSHKDEAFAKRLHADLQDKGVRCWYAPEDLPIGEKIRVGIDQAIRKHDKLLLILSEHSVNSQWVESEVEAALEKERESHKLVLFPVRIDDTVMQNRDGWPRAIKNTRNIGNFCNWKDYDAYQQVFERLVRDLKTSLKEKDDETPLQKPGFSG
ncbi:MAG: toll/interleukin-1 receptor domain-containing protein [Cyanobacteria bacterium P01_D01_bin.115]